MSEVPSSTEYDSSLDSSAASERVYTPPPRSHADVWGDKQIAENRRMVREKYAMRSAAQVEGQVIESSGVRRKDSREKLKWSAVKVVPGSVSVRSDKREDDDKSVRPGVDLPLRVREKIAKMSTFIPRTQGDSSARLMNVKGHERPVGDSTNPEWNRRSQQLPTGSSGASQKGKDGADHASKHLPSSPSIAPRVFMSRPHTREPAPIKASKSNRKSTKNVSKDLEQESEARTKEHDTQQKSDKHKVCKGNCWRPCLDCDVPPVPQKKVNSCTCDMWAGVCICKQDAQPPVPASSFNPKSEDGEMSDCTRRCTFVKLDNDIRDRQDHLKSAFSAAGLVTPPTTSEDAPSWPSDGNLDISTRADNFDNVVSSHTPPHLDNEKELREDNTSLEHALQVLDIDKYASVDLTTLQDRLQVRVSGWHSDCNPSQAASAFATVVKHQDQTNRWDLRIKWTPSLDAELRSYQGRNLDEAAASLRTSVKDCMQRWEQIKPESSEECVMLEEEQRSIPIDEYEHHHGSNDTTGDWGSNNVFPPDDAYKPIGTVLDDPSVRDSGWSTPWDKSNDWSAGQDKVLMELKDDGRSWSYISWATGKSEAECHTRFEQIKLNKCKPKGKTSKTAAREAVPKEESASASDCWGAAGISNNHDGETNQDCWNVEDFIVEEDNGSVVHPEIKDDAASANDWGYQGEFLCRICHMKACFCSVIPQPVLSRTPPASAWDVQLSIPYTVTYSATIVHKGRILHIPIDSMHVSGPEKSIIDGGMQTVWKWVQEKGLSDKVGLQDAFDLAKSIHEAEPDRKAMSEQSRRGEEVESDCGYQSRWVFGSD
ncbi:hypothetical protein N0V94_009106 [Neodidymelliopsis sp. IMI 364377]|nr:hypothetical protein N0V94_009106 [Neodidymelliopsis sp. IMI 364377]